ncbi:unnamed protein product [Mytilus edulis]|uniref:Uncharacterized protein n=1 Tax=Mytilus edulis TaxID=6550 RepID=A0A8S3TPK8_MYTED|nr:unnamed protein product [Mytilus edulis]
MCVTILTLMRRLCPKLNLDKTANIIPNTIIPIEMYCDNPYLDEKTLSKAELRQNSKYNTKHHHSYRDRRVVTILTLMRRLCPKLNLDKTTNIIPNTIIPIEMYCDNPTLMRRLCPKLNLDKTTNIIPNTIIPIEILCPKLNLDKTANIIPNTIIPIEMYCDNPYLDERLCPKLNLDKTTNIIPNTIIPIEMYCDNPYLDEKTLSKAELRQNSKYNTKHHHSYRDVL